MSELMKQIYYALEIAVMGDVPITLTVDQLKELIAEIDRLQSELNDLVSERNSLRVELHTLRFKTSQQERFIWWVWNVYSKNIQELLLELEKITFPVTPFGMSALVKHIKEGTNGIYDGTYLDVEISTGVKTSTDNNKCMWVMVEDPDIDLWCTSCGEEFHIEADTPSDNHMKYCCYCGKEIAEG